MDLVDYVFLNCCIAKNGRGSDIMQGRLENEKKRESINRERLQNEPKYMSDYYDSFTDKSYTTRDKYTSYVLEFIYFIKTEYNYNIEDVDIFSEIKVSTVNNYLKRLKDSGIGKSLQRAKFYGIKDFFNFLVNDDYIPVNPCDKINPPKIDEEINVTYMDKNEIEIFLNNIKNGVGSQSAILRQIEWRKRDYAMMTLALTLGLRVTSLTEINIEDIDFENNILKIIEKGDKTRSLIFSDNVKDALLDWIDKRADILRDIECDALFISNRKSRMTTRAVEKLVKKYSEGIDKHITPHKLRSTCGTNIYDATGDIYLTADVLGHRNIANTRRYAKVTGERKQKALTAMDGIVFK